MAQKFTVHLERVNYYTAVVTVEADNLSEARLKALAEARVTRPHSIWMSEIGEPHVVKVQAHAKLKAVP